MSTNPSPYLLIRCPAGHELQIAAEHLHQAVQCPICQTIFTPGASAPPMPTMPGPISLQYADAGIRRPIIPPQSTQWMVWLWIIAMVLLTVSSYLGAVNGTSPFFQPNPTALGGVLALVMSLNCFGGIAILAGFVMQLMWIYRIHQDAASGHLYHDVSPGLALGLSFVPLFSTPWTAWTHYKLGRHVRDRQGADSVHANDAIRASVWTLVLAILCSVNRVVGFFIGMTLGFQALAANPGALSSPGATPTPPTISPAANWMDFGLVAFNLIMTLTWGWMVLRVEKCIYAPGAPTPPSPSGSRPAF